MTLYKEFIAASSNILKVMWATLLIVHTQTLHIIQYSSTLLACFSCVAFIKFWHANIINDLCLLMY